MELEHRLGKLVLAASAFATLAAVILPFHGALAGSARPSSRDEIRPPDCVCYPVEGSAYMAAARTSVRSPVGALSPLMEGDSLVVLEGRVTVIDLRTGQRPVYGAGTRLRIPAVHQPRPTPWWRRLRDHLMQCLTGPELRRIGGSVRENRVLASPDSARYAPGVRVRFEWSDLPAAPRTIRVAGPDADTSRLELPGTPARSGGHAWDPGERRGPGPVTWALLDAEGRPLAGGRFEFLSPAQADSARSHYREEALRIYGPAERDLASVVLAVADRAYLW